MAMAGWGTAISHFPQAVPTVAASNRGLTEVQLLSLSMCKAEQTLNLLTSEGMSITLFIYSVIVLARMTCIYELLIIFLTIANKHGTKMPIIFLDMGSQDYTQ